MATDGERRFGATLFRSMQPVSNGIGPCFSLVENIGEIPVTEETLLRIQPRADFHAPSRTSGLTMPSQRYRAAASKRTFQNSTVLYVPLSYRQGLLQLHQPDGKMTGMPHETKFLRCLEIDSLNLSSVSSGCTYTTPPSITRLATKAFSDLGGAKRRCNVHASQANDESSSNHHNSTKDLQAKIRPILRVQDGSLNRKTSKCTAYRQFP